MTERQIFLDTETTGINKTGIYYEKHKIIEIGAIEVVNRRFTGNDFHVYIRPGRMITLDAFNIHGISDEFLLDKPDFAEISEEFLNYIHNAEIIIHNAKFDIGFIDYEFGKLNRNIPKFSVLCKVIDSLEIARRMFPGKRNSLDALCSRYKIDNSKRVVHSALLDAKILAYVYLAMTSYQIPIVFNTKNENQHIDVSIDNNTINTSKIRIILANDKEQIEHESFLDIIQNKSSHCLWRM